jgi:hypothetical protein
MSQKDAVSPGADLEEMQSLLYLIEEGDAHRRQGKLHHALKRYHAVRKVVPYQYCDHHLLANLCNEQVFEEFEDDQFDFHGYSLRKFTINIYLKCVVQRPLISFLIGFAASSRGRISFGVTLHIFIPSYRHHKYGPTITSSVTGSNS